MPKTNAVTPSAEGMTAVADDGTTTLDQDGNGEQPGDGNGSRNDKAGCGRDTKTEDGTKTAEIAHGFVEKTKRKLRVVFNCGERCNRDTKTGDVKPGTAQEDGRMSPHVSGQQIAIVPTFIRAKGSIEVVTSKGDKCGSAKEDGGRSQAKNAKPAENEMHGRSKNKEKEDGGKGSNKRRKAFITLSYIVVAYMVCWVPFHFVFDVSLANPDIVPEDLYTAAFWMTYVNSGLNPFMYAFSSADFRGAVVQMIKCRYCRS